jgi:hypothetical protein
MGCGSSTPDKTNTTSAPEKGKPSPKQAPQQQQQAQSNKPDSPQNKGSDPIFENELKVLGNIFARVAVGKEKQCYVVLSADTTNKTIEIVLVHGSSGDVFHASFNESLLMMKKESAKATWGVFFKLMKNGLRKATCKEPNPTDSLTMVIAVDKGPTLTFSLKNKGKDNGMIHHLLIAPLLQIYDKCKAPTGDDTKYVKIELDMAVKKATIQECEHKIGVLQAEIEPMSTSSKQAVEDARAAKEQCDGVRKRLRRLKYANNKDRDILYSDGPVGYILHTPHCKGHTPKIFPCNYHAMYWIKEKYNGDTSNQPSSPPEDNSHEAITKILQKVDDWDFDIFALQKETKGGSLFMMTYTLLYKYNLVQHFNINETTLINFLQAMESGYHENPYHNSTHAADVLQITHFCIEVGGLKQAINMTPSDCFAALLSAAMHDYDHPGFNNNFHIRTTAYLAILYNDRSVLENLHCYQIFDLVKNPKYNIFASLTWDQYKDVRDTILEMVLSTDMGLHAKIYQTFRRRIAEEKEWTSKEDQRLALSIIIKMADISNCCRPPHLYAEWGRRIAAEFYNQGDTEMRLNIPVSPFMDRRKDKVDFPKGQISFMNYIVIPLFEAGAQLLPKIQFTVEIAKKNKQELLASGITSVNVSGADKEEKDK